MKKILILLPLLFLLGTASGQRQTFTGFMDAGDAAAARDDHYNAYRLYEIATEYDTDKEYANRSMEAFYKAGTSAYHATAYGVAEKCLNEVLRDGTSAKVYPLTKYFLGQSIYRQGRYDDAVVVFDQFLEEQPGSPIQYQAAARSQRTNSNWAISMGREGDTLRHLPEGINTIDSDFNYVRGPAGNRYFSSNNFIWKADSITPKRNLGRIMKRTGETTAEPLAANINLAERTVANTAFNTARTQVYYSVCEYVENDELRCDLYRADLGTDGNWTNPQKLSINDAAASTTQPSVGTINGSEEEFLFFASDRQGGKGDLDLYRAKINADGSIETPENLERINTPGQDASPFWYAPRQTLYFSSDGRFTFGGLDINRAYFDERGGFRKPINLGSPVNSSYEEGYYTRFDDPDKAFVASRRPDSTALFYTGQREICCYEIYEFTPDPRIDLLATTFNKLTLEELKGVTVALYDVSGPEPVLIREITEEEGNEFYFLVEPGKQYELRATKDGFSKAIDAFDLKDPELKDLGFIERKLYLAPLAKLEVFTFNNVDLEPLPGVTVQLFEMTDDTTKVLVETIENPDDNDFYFSPEFGKRYYIEGKRADYGIDYEEVDLRELDGSQGINITRELYLGQMLKVLVVDGFTSDPLDSASVRLIRANGQLVDERTNYLDNEFNYIVNLDQAFVVTTRRPGYDTRTDTLYFSQQDLIDAGGELTFEIPMFYDNVCENLPLLVFFDNDYPKPRYKGGNPLITYPETYQSYLARQEDFLEGYTAEMEPAKAFLERGFMTQFFDQRVTDGYNQLRTFAEALSVYLTSGRKIELELRGFASPRAPTLYNEKLSDRRIESVIRFFRSYDNDALLTYIEDGDLSFVRKPLGESTADLSLVSDRLDRPAESVFSIVASLERRVEITCGLKTKK